MTSLATQLMNDEAGFIVSAELVLIATVGVLAMVVGLSEVALNINKSFMSRGSRGHGGGSEGGRFKDNSDFCDRSGDIQSVGGRGES